MILHAIRAAWRFERDMRRVQRVMGARNMDTVNTDERVQVEVRPFMVPILALAEQRMAEQERQGSTMAGQTVGGLGNRMQRNATAFNSEYTAQDLPRVTPDTMLQHLADTVNLAGLTSHLFIAEQADKDKE